MGGYGSGRTSSKQIAEQCKSLDVNRFHRDGCLRPGSSGNWVWSRDGEEVERINYRAEERRLVLDYKVRVYGGDWEPISQPIRITHVDCNYGNKRPYFMCPGVVNGRHCGRRVGKLFSGGRYFLCRHCYRIAYASQSEARYDRMLRRANKLRMALGGEPGTAYLIALKPKGMWQRTYQRKRREITWCESQADHLFIAKYANILSKEEREMFLNLDIIAR
ncbi:hypothetical protein [Sulfitobacter mediterraneus]|uniref:Uncharacterized protein n=1 Tax=Sulfitobacter mediterraneus TaxID=83219 RepID=A0A2T6CD26_9RHOB|nr:hypothetical protein [Sulfitobacter mediterraneus]KIN79616.1 hypothetical protein Z950_150 [Sulfitobacter mediterraneus KCTC 32188]PTX73400.1 hypothetical protein C8N31_107101 [Sulfitobacter mediterraneus]